jgi:2,3-diketo-5-methylthio-1-phosphopentane phosphatase
MRYVALYRKGEIGSAQVYRAIGPMIQMTQRDMDSFVLEHAELDPAFPPFLQWTQERGIDVKVISDGFDSTIKTLFRNHRISDLDIYANKLSFSSDGKIRLISPHANPDCGKCGTCKVMIIREMRKFYDRIVLIGDGESDRHAAEEADATLALKDLFVYCADAGIPAVRLSDFSEAPGLLIRRVEAVMYDMDGTLVDSAPSLTRSFNHMFKALGYPEMSREDVMRKTSLSLVDFVKEYLRPEDGVRGVHVFREHYSKVFLQETGPMPEALRIIEELGAKRSQGIVTNKKGEFARQLAERLGFSRHITRVIGAQDGYSPKPSGDMILAFLDFVSVGRDSGVYVGDGPVDIQAAKAAGVDCFALAGDYFSAKELALLQPRRVLGSLSELPEALEPII